MLDLWRSVSLRGCRVRGDGDGREEGKESVSSTIIGTRGVAFSVSV